MHTLPATIETAIRQQLIVPLVEVLTGQRAARDIEPIAAPGVVLRLSIRPRRRLPIAIVRTVRVQRVHATHAIEVAATVTDHAGRVHPLGVRVEGTEGKVQISAVATDLWGPDRVARSASSAAASAWSAAARSAGEGRQSGCSQRTVMPAPSSRSTRRSSSRISCKGSSLTRAPVLVVSQVSTP
jgi:hypothetical protein